MLDEDSRDAEAVPQPETPIAASVPLCVDLDGTLVKSDTLVDSLLALLRTRQCWPSSSPASSSRQGALQGIRLEIHLVGCGSPALQPTAAPVSTRGARARPRDLPDHGRRHGACQRVALHLGIFAGVLASDGVNNLTGGRKLASLRANLVPDRSIISATTRPICQCWSRRTWRW